APPAMSAPAPAAARPEPAVNEPKVVPVAPKAAPKAPRPAPAAAPEPLRQDRLQELDNALAGCARENFFGRVVCEQRARLQYCNGYWGKAPQCPDAQGPGPGK
ncbi:MAG: hypothetical protein ABI569_10795, partial [Casimicrobiaceae bacterium]